MMKLRKNIIRIAALIFIGLVILFYLFIQHRTGPDYAEHFARLLPPETAAIASLQNLETLWNQATALKVTSQIMESPELSHLLLSSEDMQEWKKNLSEIEYKTRMELGKDFILKWIGQDAAVALVSPQSEGAPPGILVMSKTKIGFEEKLAELVALYYPDLNLETESWKGVSINRYKGKKESRSFSYLRFGRTVILSLRSSDISLLQKIIDLKKDKNISSLYGSEYFRMYLTSLKQKAGISLFVHKDRMMDYLKRAQTYSESKGLADTLPRINDILNPFGYMQLNIRLDQGVKGEAGFYYSTPLEKTSQPPVEFQSLAKLPDNTSLFFGIKDSNISGSFKTILKIFFQNGNADNGSEAELTELETLLEKQIFSLVKNEIVISLFKMEPGFLTPLMNGDIFLEAREPEKANAEMRNMMESMGASGDIRQQRILTPIGTLGYIMQDDFVRIMVRSQPDALQDNKTEFNLSNSHLFQELFPSGIKESHVVLFINFERISEDLEELAKRSIRWNDKTRERVKRFHKWAGVCRYLKGCAVQDQRDGKAVVYHIRIPVE